MTGYRLLACCACLVLAVGCGTVLVRPFFPRTGAHGIVVDQFDRPVTNCDMRADWVPVSWEWVLLPTQSKRHFQTDKDGRWRFNMRDANYMYIGPSRWTMWGTEEFLGSIGPIRSGECPTNEFIFRLEITQPDQRK